MTIIIGNIVALAASILLVYSGIIKKKKKILYVQSIQIGLFIISNIILGGIPGALMNGVSFIRNILCYKNKLGTEEKVFITIISIVLTIMFNNLGFIGLLPFFATIIYLWGMTIKNVIKFKTLIAITTLLWCVYDFSIQSYTSALFDAMAILSNFITIVEMKRAKLHKLKYM